MGDGFTIRVASFDKLLANFWSKLLNGYLDINDVFGTQPSH